MKRQRRVEITVETEVSVAIRGGMRAGRDPCPQCGGVLLSPWVAARMASTSVRQIYQMVENGSLHYAEIGGEGLVCFSDSQTQEVP